VLILRNCPISGVHFTLTFEEALATAEPEPIDGSLYSIMGSYLLKQKKGVLASELAQVANVELADVEKGLLALDEGLGLVGMRLNRSAVGVKIVSVNRPEIQSNSAASRTRYLANLNNGDLRLLYRIMSSDTPLNGVTQSVNFTMSLQKLEGAGLIKFVSNQPIAITERASRILY